ncbi:MAG: CvpA family protein [Armatimonadota bacterium]|nr:CvpA family protein [Armatimonadota bacterium]MDR7402804.1 CvpA family protein [Armatimonadota bacterium]MDR7404643.1 CvpA family protein [Armatimonadota bacterium]MDR7437055.1 CvpA family protein [Armatimonadota bacterium]MDR7472874.1 CvpA family protein [Armatimonadota bacterium]
MTWLDWAIVAVLALGALRGLRRGVGVALASAVGVFGGYLAASAWYPSLALALRAVRLSAPWAGAVAYAVLLVGVYVFVGALASAVLERGSASVSSRLAGLVVGAAAAALLSAAVLGWLLATPLHDPVSRDAARSVLAPHAIRVHRDGARALAKVLPPFLRPFGAEPTRF